MHPVPRVLFDELSSQPDDDARRPAPELAIALGETLRARQFACSDVRLRRAAGWSLAVSAGLKHFEIRYSRLGGRSALVTVAPLGGPGTIARLLGRSAVPVGAELRALCLAVHHQLTITAAVRNVRWMLGGPPEQVPHVETPRELPWPEGA